MDAAASKIKKFFSKKKSEAKFKTAGPGRKLTDSAASSSSTSSHSKKPKDVYVPPKRNDLTDEAKTARDAALRRIMENNANKPLNISSRAIKEQARKELEEQRKAETESSLKQLNITDSDKKDYSIEGVFFTCPLVSDEILPKNDWQMKIKAFLYEQLESDPGLTSCLIIKNCNTLDRAESCIETLQKYLQNIINNPSEEKFHRIRTSNRIFCDKVGNCEGSLEFLRAAGFHENEIDGDKFLVWSPDFPTEMLVQLCEALDLCEVINLDIDRNMKVLLPSQIKSVNLPPEFFRISPEELKKEQQARTAALEEAQMLKTKAMRENEEKRYARNFKYSLIRIRFPDGLYLQGTFGAQEKLSTVFDFVMGALQHETAEFSLISPDGQKFSNEDADQTLVALKLVPNTTLKFAYEGDSRSLQEFIKEELLLLVQSL
ncbi:CLUMA_CG008973, isoform A [Clunio marinus]|uniref:CLUMA_CG008973, isoform A n=1 Tax=Clunio marinus TaxID=568069 RepID=A0A1J1I5E4_9DIPT|nr:CLUMA_CG008973, isoform A [Clunio marinus]